MPVTPAPARHRTRNLLTRRNFLIASAASVPGMALYSNEISRHELEVIDPTFHITRLPPAFDGFRIAQISDIHLEEFTEDYFLQYVIDRVNALAPDMVLVTGDFVSNGPLPHSVAFDAARRCGKLLATLRCPLRYGILGNHDWNVDPKLVRDCMEANGLPILDNQYVRIERAGQYIYLSGLQDAAVAHPDLNLALPKKPDAPVLLMVHEPDYAQNVVANPLARGVDFILSGHTHGGQIRVPGLRPLVLPPLGKLYPEGLFHLGNSQLYVNRGIGTVGIPFRLNCPPEITLATLRPDLTS
jgi:predicted MPP superfamily phosphohydrolase